jgi:CubicO group peptidase (beta-lactamase class C family)
MPTPARTVLVALVAVLAMRTAAAASPPSLYDVPALEAFLDGAVEALLETREVPGISVAIVKEGRVLLEKGYGVASLESGSAVSADRTLFRIGSVSKTFLATAIMQLVEQGKLDLETDVNVYLDGVHVPETFAEPVTLTHVMTHTAGFEESTLGELWADSAAEIPPLVNELARYLPARVRPPGELVAYSNHATAIAALVVQQVSGIPYDEYLE